MSNDTLIKDIETAAEIARSGQASPLLGGPFSLMWGALITVALTLQYLVLEQVIGVPLSALPILWIVFALVGSAGNILLGRRQARMPGSNSVGNRVETAVWIMFSAVMATVFVATLAAIFLGLQTNSVWGVLVVIGLMGQGLAYGTTTRIQPSGFVTFSAIASLAAGSVALAFHDQTLVYLIGAIGTFVALVIPAIFQLRG